MTDLFVYVVGLTKAFDAVSWDALWVDRRILDVPEQLFSVIVFPSGYDCPRSSGEVSDPFIVSKGTNKVLVLYLSYLFGILRHAGNSF